MHLDIIQMIDRKLDAKQREKRFEELAIELHELKSPEGKAICLTQAMEMTALYIQAEQELLDLKNAQSR